MPLNKVILQGRMVAKAELKQSARGDDYSFFSMAVDRPGVNGERGADFFNCVAFGKTAAVVAKWLDKGSAFIAEGRLKTGVFEDSQGIKKKEYKILVTNVHFFGGQRKDEKDIRRGGVGDFEEGEELPF